MINKFIIKQLLKIIFFFALSSSNLIANDVLIDAEVVDIQENGNLIIATGSVNIVDNDLIKITGEEAKKQQSQRKTPKWKKQKANEKKN